jgi:hypothetical protein
LLSDAPWWVVCAVLFSGRRYFLDQKEQKKTVRAFVEEKLSQQGMSIEDAARAIQVQYEVLEGFLDNPSILQFADRCYLSVLVGELFDGAYELQEICSAQVEQDNKPGGDLFDLS